MYIHIPFCRQACRYCDFFFSVSLRYQEEFVNALVLELEANSKKNQNQEMESIYLGGGTPSFLSSENLFRILNVVRNKYLISEQAEVTIECNPDDLDASRVHMFQSLGINRLSIGIQSFDDRDLKLMRRSHGATQAEKSVEIASSAGFENISVDLIYGIPGQSPRGWKENIFRALSLPVTHLSAYHLTFEKGTVFDHWRKKGRLIPVPEEQSEIMYGILRENMLKTGFEHYEISNFAREGYRSRHNQLYWSGKPYLGLGPSAHSFDGNSRSWNVSSLKGYMESVTEGKSGKSEILSLKERYHDYLITSLRTSKGADRACILQQFGDDYRRYFDKQAGRFISAGSLCEEGDRLFIDPKRWLLADHIISGLFMD
ncbi:MAG: radical SAM family heme chaperone HemW [Bacteroidota bacterium]